MSITTDRVNVNFRSPAGLLTQSSNKDDRKDKVAAGVGVGAGVNQAGRFMSKRALKASNVAAQAEAAEGTLQTMLNNVTQTTGAIKQNSEVASGLWAKFKFNTKFYTNDLLAKLKNIEGVKFVGKIAKSPIVKKGASVVGGSLAFFVLVTGVSKAVKTGQIAVDDFKDKYNDMNSFYRNVA